MEVVYQKLWSENLGRDMEFKVYGHAGKPMLVFPSGCGRFFEFEDFGMLEVVREFVEAGKVQIYTIDSIDCEAWLADWMYPGDRALRHLQYERYVLEEFLPFMRVHSDARADDKFIAMGCSMGGYHAANFFFKHPELFDTLISLSGLYGPEHFVGNYMDDNVYFNFPLTYLPHLDDPWYLDQFRESDIIICVGQGLWEGDSIIETQALEESLHTLGVHAWIDYWGYNVSHDWPWWQKQLPYFLGELNL